MPTRSRQLSTARQQETDACTPTEFPPRTETTDANGVTTIVEYRLNDDGKRVKVTRRIKRTLVKKHVNHVVAERMHWKKCVRGGRGSGERVLEDVDASALPQVRPREGFARRSDVDHHRRRDSPPQDPSRRHQGAARAGVLSLGRP